MDIKDYIRQCVAKHIELTGKTATDWSVFVECAKSRRYGFVQIGPIIYIPNTTDEPFHGVFVRSSDVVTGWEEFDETDLLIPHVGEIQVHRD